MFENFYNFNLLDSKDSGVNWNEKLEIVYIVKGSGTLLIDELENYYELKESDIFVVNGFQPRDIILHENSLALALYIDYQFIFASNPEVVSPYFEAKSFLYTKDNQATFNKLRKSFADLLQTHYKSKQSFSITLRTKTMALLNDLFTFFLVENKSFNLTNLDKIREVVNYIHKSYRYSITLNQLAEQADLSKSYLSALFKEIIGLNIFDYITQVRINHSIKMLLQDKTLTEIAYESGFPNTNSMISAYNKYKKKTPSDYRKHLKTNIDLPSNDSQLFLNEESYSELFKPLLAYLDNHKKPISAQEIKKIRVDLKSPIKKMSNAWNKVINVGYARDLLDFKLQSQLIDFQKKMNFEYLRIKGILDDDMFFLTLGLDGKEKISYTYINKVIDFVLSLNAKPMIEIGHMPTLYAKHHYYKIRHSAYLSLPKSNTQWGKIVNDLMVHLKNRYGEKVVSQWIISPWFTVDYHQFSVFSLKEYEATYIASYNAIKNNLPNVKISGPGIALNNLDLFSWYLEMIEKNKLKIDIFTFKSYESMDKNLENLPIKLIDSSEAFPFAVSNDENYINTHLKSAKTILKTKHYENPTIIIEEWSNNIWQRDLCNDTTFKAAYIFKTLLQNDDIYSGIAYHSFSDNLGELDPVSDEFSGGFGLYTQNGIAKSAFYAIQLLSKIGDTILAQGDNYLITSKARDIQIFTYNYAHYDTLYRYRHVTNLSKTKRDGVFLNKSSISLNFQLLEVFAGEYEIISRAITKSQGSAYDAWLSIGAPDEMTKEEINYINALSTPAYFKTVKEVTSQISVSIKLKPQEVSLYEIKYKGS